MDRGHTTAQPALTRGYRIRVAALAVFGDVGWRVATLLPWAFVTGLGLLWWNQTWPWVVYGVALVFFWWLISPTHVPIGRPLARNDAPGLTEVVEALRKTLQTPPIHDIVLVDELNAGAAQRGLAWWPWGQRNMLVLGIPLLAMLSPAQARAVIGHELGHFSRRHGALGHWIYRARLGWLSLGGSSQTDDSAFDRLVTWFANAFVPYFSRYAFAHSRQCEFEADRDAAEVASAADLVSALALMHMAQHRLNGWLQCNLAAVKLAEPRAPSNWWLRMQSVMLSPRYEARELADAWAQASDTSDTHPCLSLRAASLGVELSAVEVDTVQASSCAGAAWLGTWSRVVEDSNRSWEQAQSRCWRVDHVMMHVHVDREAELAAAGESTVERVRLLAALGRIDDALASAGALLDRGDASPALKATVGMLRLAHRPEDAAMSMKLLDQAVAADIAWAYPARHAALEAARRLQDAAQVERLEVLLERAGVRRAQAADAIHRCIEASQLQAPRMRPALLDAIDALCEAEPALQSAWTGSCQVNGADGRSFDAHALVLRVNPDALRNAAGDEDDLCDAFEEALWHARAHEAEMIVVRVCYVTEAQLPELLGKSAARHWKRRG